MIVITSGSEQDFENAADEDAVFTYLVKRSNTVDIERTLRDVLLIIPGDIRYTYYMIVSDSPLKAVHLPFGGVPRLDKAKERVIDAEYVRRMVRISRAWGCKQTPESTVTMPVTTVFNQVTGRYICNNVCEV